jgi:hypothetical protein
MDGVSGVSVGWLVVFGLDSCVLSAAFFLLYYGFIALYGHCMNEWA